jgi:hypothetical protein
MQSIGPIHAWEAFSEKGKPWCIVGSSEEMEGFSLNLYFGKKKGHLKGVEVYDRTTGETVSVVGEVPKAKVA